MGFLQIPPPQGFSREQELSIITGPASPRYAPPQGEGGGISPGVDSELFDEDGVQGAVIFDDGTETGFVLVQES